MNIQRTQNYAPNKQVGFGRLAAGDALPVGTSIREIPKKIPFDTLVKLATAPENKENAVKEGNLQKFCKSVTQHFSK